MPIWETLKFEKIMQKSLIHELGETTGQERYGFYTIARNNLLENILGEISARQPELTDHGPDHIKNVLENITDLLGDSIGTLDSDSGNYKPGELTSMEIYVLGISALFHDVGNIFRRMDHQNLIESIYNETRHLSVGNQDTEEKKIILDICKAHCGEGFDGSKNTLAYVKDITKLERKKIRPIILAPILRIADELAEGEQRTSQFMIRHHQYSKQSMSYHLYAQSSRIDIDRALGKIKLQFHIHLKLEPSTDGDPQKISINELENFLNFVYSRIEKLNQERQYTKHYCSLLEPFKETSASFSFWFNDNEILIDIAPLIITDLVVPCDPQKLIVDRDDNYKPNKLIDKLTDEIHRMTIAREQGDNNE